MMAALEEQVEDHEIKGTEHADHHGFHDQEGDHVLLDARRDRFPTGEDAERREQRSQEERRASKYRRRPCGN